MTNFIIGKGWNYIGTTGGCSCSGGKRLKYTNTIHQGYEIRILNESFEIRKHGQVKFTGQGKERLEQIYAQEFPA